MRLFMLVLSIVTVFLDVNCAKSDDQTAQWVLGAVCTSNPGGESVNSPACNNDSNNDDNFNLNPSRVDAVVECSTKDGHPGVCVLYYQCNPTTRTVIEDGAGIFDLRMKSCIHYLETCCKENEIQSRDSYIIEDSNRSKDDEKDPTITPSPFSNTVTTKRPKPKPITPKSKNQECGWSNHELNVPIPNLEKLANQESPIADYGDFPWMVAFMRKSENDVWSHKDYLGGGTLIHPSVVLTVAHKLSIRTKKLEANQIKCRAGEWDTQTTTELFPYQERDVAKYIEHENYYRRSLYNDIALLILEKPFDLADAPHIGMGCLANALPAPGYECFSMGWGKDFNSKDKKKYALILKKVNLKYVDSNNCQTMLRDSRLGSLFKLHESLICANGEKGVDTCRGDGGSPLVCPIRNEKGEVRYAVYGIVAYGIACGDPKIPATYANIPLLRSWVDEKMQQEGFGTASYTI